MAAVLACSVQFSWAQQAPAGQVKPSAAPPPQVAASAQNPAASQLPADLPLRREADSSATASAGYVIWILTILGSVALLAAFGLRRGIGPDWLARFRPIDRQPVLKVVSATALGSGSSLQVVRWGDREMLLGCTPQSIRLLDSRESGRNESGAT
jgi:flagellar biogenesis protein FliO